MNQDERMAALRIISETQMNSGSTTGGTSSATVKIGGTKPNGQVQHDTLFVQDAPAAIVDALRDAGFTLSMGEQGLRVEAYNVDLEDGE